MVCEVLNGVGVESVDGLGGTFPFFGRFLCFSLFFSFFSAIFFAVLLTLLARTRETTAIYCKMGTFTPFRTS